MALRRPVEEALEFNVDTMPKIGGRLYAIDPKACDDYHADLTLWMQRLMSQIKREVVPK